MYVAVVSDMASSANQLVPVDTKYVGRAYCLSTGDLMAIVHWRGRPDGACYDIIAADGQTTFAVILPAEATVLPPGEWVIDVQLHGELQFRVVTRTLSEGVFTVINRNSPYEILNIDVSDCATAAFIEALETHTGMELVEL